MARRENERTRSEERTEERKSLELGHDPDDVEEDLGDCGVGVEVS